MNKNAKPTTRLAIDRQTIKQLQETDLQRTAGGATSVCTVRLAFSCPGNNTVLCTE